MRAKVENVARLRRKLAAIPRAMEAEINAARRKSADELVATMKSIVPAKSGALRRSIRSRAVNTTTDDTKAGAIIVGAGDDEAWYARLVEYGTAPHPQGGMFAGTQHPGTPPTNFFFGTYRLYRKRIISRIRSGARKGAKIAAGRR